jgi:hypothetical protein
MRPFELLGLSDSRVIWHQSHPAAPLASARAQHVQPNILMSDPWAVSRGKQVHAKRIDSHDIPPHESLADVSIQHHYSNHELTAPHVYHAGTSLDNLEHANDVLAHHTPHSLRPPEVVSPHSTTAKEPQVVVFMQNVVLRMSRLSAQPTMANHSQHFWADADIEFAGGFFEPIRRLQSAKAQAWYEAYHAFLLGIPMTDVTFEFPVPAFILQVDDDTSTDLTQKSPRARKQALADDLAMERATELVDENIRSTERAKLQAERVRCQYIIPNQVYLWANLDPRWRSRVPQFDDGVYRVHRILSHSEKPRR